MEANYNWKYIFWVVIFTIFATLISATCFAYTDVQIADAIYLAEGGAKAKVPYGILSVKVKDEAEARQVCLNTIRNAKRRYEKTNKEIDFITFLGLTYCPPNAHSLNKNWVKNVKYFLEKGAKK